ncbi:MAG: M48 family metallopeptidase [Bacteroidales bacterium]|nr:M48 family metallopeptidase [Bacteroidales bacterium]
MQEKIYQDPQIGQVTFRRSARARRICIRVHPAKGVTVSVPHMTPFIAAEAFFRLKREWVIETVAKQKSRFGNVTRPSDGEIERLRKAAKEVLPVRLQELAGRYGFTYGKVTVKHNLTNWGSCSTRGNINLNLNIMRLPKVLRDYILLHELCHLRHHDHGHAFHLLLEHLLSDNLLKLLDAETGAEREFISELARKAALSGARYPIDHTMTHAIRQYPLM